MKIRLFTLLALGAVCSAAHANDPFAFNNFDSVATPSFYNSTGWLVGSSSSNYGQNGVWLPQEQFTAAAGGAVTNITVAVGDDVASGDQSFTVNLYADSAGNPGAIIGSWTATTDGQFFDGMSDSDLESIAISGGPSLAAGGLYWLGCYDPNAAAYSGDDAFVWDWCYASDRQAGGMEENSTGAWAYGYLGQGAFSVSVNSTSVPGPLAVLPFALGVLIRKRRR